MSVKLSCGHEPVLNEVLRPVPCKDTAKDGQRCVSYKTLCSTCLKDYEVDGIILHDEIEEELWIARGDVQKPILQESNDNDVIADRLLIDSLSDVSDILGKDPHKLFGFSKWNRVNEDNYMKLVLDIKQLLVYLKNKTK